jgi:hypothetical protein
MAEEHHYELVSSETAKIAHDKGFSENTNYVYSDYYGGTPKPDTVVSELEQYGPYIPAPPQTMLQKWLRDEHLIFVSVVREPIGSDEWEWAYTIEYLPKKHHNEKRRTPFFVTIKSFHEGPGSYTGAWHDYEQALEEGLQKGLSLILQ